MKDVSYYRKCINARFFFTNSFWGFWHPIGINPGAPSISCNNFFSLWTKSYVSFECTPTHLGKKLLWLHVLHYRKCIIIIDSTFNIEFRRTIKAQPAGIVVFDDNQVVQNTAETDFDNN